MKLTKFVLAVFVMCTLFISCTEESVFGDDELFLTEEPVANDDDDTPPIDNEGNGG